ncbi:MAG: hypothetical protein GYA23_11905 [Methanomicrobiales archaeon]|nr:hypothetical protein [Methanomicrobiales archaeon]
MTINAESSQSPVVGTILLILLVVILALVVLAMIWLLPAMYDPDYVPTIFEIQSIKHTNDHGMMTYESYVVLKNIGNRAYDNRYLCVKTYRNKDPLPFLIPTLNADGLINPGMHPPGIASIGGFGTKNFMWNPGATLFIDYNDRTFHPKDVMTIEVYNRTTNRIISRDTWPHTEGNSKKWMDLVFSHRGA